MSDKKLLEEQTIRRFMKLAKIEGLADNFVENNTGVIKEGKSERREISMDTKKRGEYASGKVHEEKEEEMGDYGMKEEEEDLMSPESAGGGDKEALVQSMFEAMAEAAKEHGVDVEVEGGEGGMGDDEMGDDEMGDDEMGGMDLDMDEPPDEEDEEEEDEEEEEEEGESMDEAKEEDEEEKKEVDEGEEEEAKDLAEAVLYRVKARLIAEARAAKEKTMKGAKGKAKIAAKKGSKKNGAGMATQGSVGKGKVSTPFGASVKEGAKGKGGLANQGGIKKSGTFGTKHPGKDHKMTAVGKTGPKKHKA